MDVALFSEFMLWSCHADDRAFDTIELRQDKQSAEQKLKESEERFREMAELLPETIYEMDVDGQLTFVNHRALEQFGYTQADLDRGLYGLKMLLPEDRLAVSILA